MKNKLFKIFACFLTLTFVATPTSATLITDSDTVIVGDKEWAQVDLFYDLSWNDINGVCPNGICGSGILNSYDMTGWTWATAAEVRESLFSSFVTISNTGPVLASEMEFYMFLNEASFDTYRFDILGNVSFSVAGFNSGITTNTGEGFLSSVFLFQNSPPLVSIWESGLINQVDGDFATGAWMYRAATVPEPSTLAVLALGMLGLGARRFKK